MNNYSQLLKYQNFTQHCYNLDSSCRAHHKFWKTVIEIIKPYLIDFLHMELHIFHSKIQYIPQTLHPTFIPKDTKKKS